MVLPTPVTEPDVVVPTALSPDDALQRLVESTYTTSTLEFYLNGTKIQLRNPNPHWTLLDFIRSQHGLKGTKLGCGEGGCGACTVVLQVPEARNGGRIRHLAVNACLYPLVGVVGKHVITVEGLGNVNNPHPLQERLAKLHGSQCGFCTPGIVMSLYAMIRNAYDPQSGKFKLSEEDIELKGHLDGNLCRCTGYKPILQAAKTFVTEDLQGQLADDSVGTAVPPVEQNGVSYLEASLSTSSTAKGSCGRPGGCCRDDPARKSCSSASSGEASQSSSDEETSITSQSDEDGEESKPWTSTKSVPQFNFRPYSPSTELIYPPALRKFVHLPICYGDENKVWLRPVKLQQLVELLAAYPSAKLVSGASEVQIEVRFKASNYPVSVFIGDIDELTAISVPEDVTTMKEMVIGGNTSLTDIEAVCSDLSSKLGLRGSVFGAMAKVLRYFAGRQIRNAASLAGNIATASPISDMNPVLMAVNATVVALTAKEEVSLPMASMFQGYRKTSLPPGSVITRIQIPIPAPGVMELTKSYKQSKRKEDDIAIVTAGFRVRLNEKGIVEDVSLAYGGMAPVTLLATDCAKFLIGKQWKSSQTLQGALKTLEQTFQLPYGVPGGMATYRRTLALSMFFRFWHEVIAEIKLGEVDPGLIEEIHRSVSSGTRDNYNPHEQRVVGKQIPHLSGLKHTTGEAEYLDDMPHHDRELYGALVLSQKAHAIIKSVDWSPALKPGLALGYIDKNSIDPERNSWGMIKDEPWFATDKVYSHGQPIGMVYAETALKAQEAARAVRVEYEELKPILTIDEAIEAKSFYPYGKELRKGAPPEEMAQVFAKCDRVFEGVSRVGGQEHFYLETNAAMVIPHAEDNSMEVWSSTQHTMEIQETISRVTGIPSNRINARVKRMGGAFGGKESRSAQLAGLLAIAAMKERRPMRAMLNRDEDMITTGQRHPIKCRWKVGVMNDGTLVALEADCYNNAGYSLDMSASVMDRCMTHIDNCYQIPNVHIRGWVCKTNTHSNTAFRGFGAPQAMFFTETFMNAVAEGLNMDIDELRWKNLYKQGDRTPFLQMIDEDWHIPMLLEQVRKEARYDERKAQVAQFNSRNKWKKRGICLIPTKFGLSFATALHLNQGAASVKIYTDGTVLLNHGGTEMGQGLYTKMCQIAAQELNVPLENVYTADTSSYQTPNASPTAASSGSDLNGMAIKDACDQLNERLRPYWERFGPKADFKDIVQAAYKDRVNLAATGHWKMPRIGYQFGNYDPETVKPMYYYFTQVEITISFSVLNLDSDHTVLRTDIKMDVGRSINPAIDYGQIEGAFVQGQGLFTIEESLWTNDGSGQLATRGPGTYKIPGFSDIPQEFNVSFLQGVSWKSIRSIQSSKGIGEPPLFLGSTVLFALREALRSARADNGVTEPLLLDSPATAERLRLAVGDALVKMATVTPKPGEKPFFLTVS
ncbi:Xanthine dehydrogenase [Rasamsonia emersonii CBS 393.64]|uniref:xanthine dehydrogenase n=1 Tax=Rasamsonia emersonii (strain ATCC 16479 / CBS 393.64 / IMI 116815) TaxID=1408163 RepID=A0A0F4YQ97_RASE3|nr:Xanthine dehydrogenase [Rasamsonia emersonii CBS 393.64]KKA20457.1 Xanthine dehydrogenase [Rasamsonia emersonii CBS 393.64]